MRSRRGTTVRRTVLAAAAAVVLLVTGILWVTDSADAGQPGVRTVAPSQAP